MRVDLVYLLTEDPAAHGVLEEIEPIGRPVYCEVQSVGQTEVYQARAVGLSPEFRLVLNHSFEYKGEKLCLFHDQLYNIIRTYMQKGDGIELTIQRADGNAAAEEEDDV